MMIYDEWGIFYHKIQKRRNSRNPKNGEIVLTPEKKVINFKMSKEIFNRVNEK